MMMAIIIDEISKTAEKEKGNRRLLEVRRRQDTQKLYKRPQKVTKRDDEKR